MLAVLRNREYKDKAYLPDCGGSEKAEKVQQIIREYRLLPMTVIQLQYQNQKHLRKSRKGRG